MLGKAQHSSLPWSITEFPDNECGGGEPTFRISADSTLMVDFHACADGFQVDQNEANARLFLMAPHLLRVAESILALDHGDPDIWHFDPEFNQAREVVALVRLGTICPDCRGDCIRRVRVDDHMESQPCPGCKGFGLVKDHAKVLKHLKGR